MTCDTYQTISNPAQGAYKEKGSKFLSYLYPVQTAEQAMGHVEELRTKFYDARHHCYAYRLGPLGETWRANDDGEPSGTAARPMLGALHSANLTNTLAVVVRYFGGTKLGTSGLITAYKQAVTDAVQAAIIIEKTIDKHFVLHFPYEQINDVMRLIKTFNPTISEQNLNTSSTISLAIRQSLADAFTQAVGKTDNIEIKEKI